MCASTTMPQKLTQIGSCDSTIAAASTIPEVPDIAAKWPPNEAPKCVHQTAGSIDPYVGGRSADAVDVEGVRVGHRAI